MVPESIQRNGCGSSADISEVTDSGGGCGNGGGGRASGGEMLDMENELIATAKAKRLETEIALPPRQKNKGKQQTPKKVRDQKMSNCKKCGYLTSSDLCQACALLGGLNKNRPIRPIEVEAADS